MLTFEEDAKLEVSPLAANYSSAQRSFHPEIHFANNPPGSYSRIYGIIASDVSSFCYAGLCVVSCLLP